MPLRGTLKKRSSQYLVLALLLMWAPLLAFATPSASGAEPVHLEFFKRQGCPHCAEAADFLDELASRHSNLEIAVYDVGLNAGARDRLLALCRQFDIATPGVPAFYLRGRLLVGFSGRDRSGAQIERLVLDGNGARDPPTGMDTRARPREAHVPVLGSIRSDELGLPIFTITLGFVDGINPCATWVLLFLLSILVNLKSRSKMLLIGGIFVAASGLVYFAFMAAWLNMFLVLGVSHVIAVILGLVAVLVGSIHIKDFFALNRGLSLSIPDSAKPGIYARARKVISAEHLSAAVASVVTLAVLVNLVELLCTAGLPAVYTAVLTAHELPAWQYYAYLLLYMVAYMIDDAILLSIAVITLSKHKLQDRGARVLKLLSGSVMLGLGLTLLLRPDWLGW